jgi:AcrR family transcriptional regulator
MQDICEKSGLSPGAVYRYFKGKEDIISAICDENYKRDLALVESIKGGSSALDVMEDLGRTFLNGLTIPEVKLKMDLLAECPRSPHIQETVRKGVDDIISSFVDFVRTSQSRGDVNPDLDPEAAARVMCAIYTGFVVQKHTDPSIDPNTYFDTVVAIFRGAFFVQPKTLPQAHAPSEALAH